MTTDIVTEGSTVNLRYVKFQSVNSLSVSHSSRRHAQKFCVGAILPNWLCSGGACRPRAVYGRQADADDVTQIFCGSNFGDEEQTVIHRLVLFGLPGNLTDMNRWSEVAKKG